MIGALATLLNGILGAYQNTETQNTYKQINNQNIQFQQQENEINRILAQQENEITREREDTQLQRKVQDAIAAGFSPLAALDTGGSYASQGTVIPGTAPIAQPYTTDYSSLINAIATTANVMEQTKTQKETKEKDNTTQKEIAMKNIEQRNKELSKNIEIKNTELQQNFKEFLMSYGQQAEELKLKQTEQKDEINIKLQDRSFQKWQQISKTLGFDLPTKEYKDYNEYLTAFEKSNENLQTFLQKLQENGQINGLQFNKIAFGESSSNGKTDSGGWGVGANAKIPGIPVPGMGVDVNGNWSHGNTSATAENSSYDQTQYNAVTWSTLAREYKVFIPIYTGWNAHKGRY